MKLGANDQNRFVLSCLDESIGDTQCVHEAGTGIPNVRRPHRIQSQHFLDQDAITGEVVVRGNGGKYNVIDFAGRNARMLYRHLGRFMAHRGRGPAIPFFHPSTRLNPCSFLDPCIARIHELTQVGIINFSRRQEMSQALDKGGIHRAVISL